MTQKDDFFASSRYPDGYEGFLKEALADKDADRSDDPQVGIYKNHDKDVQMILMYQRKEYLWTSW